MDIENFVLEVKRRAIEALTIDTVKKPTFVSFSEFGEIYHSAKPSIIKALSQAVEIELLLEYEVWTDIPYLKMRQHEWIEAVVGYEIYPERVLEGGSADGYRTAYLDILGALQIGHSLRGCSWLKRNLIPDIMLNLIRNELQPPMKVKIECVRKYWNPTVFMEPVNDTHLQFVLRKILTNKTD